MIQASTLHGNPATNLLSASQLCVSLGGGCRGSHSCRLLFPVTIILTPPQPQIVFSRESQRLFQAPTMCQVLARERS